MTKRCAILGASGHGKVVAEIAQLNGYSDVCFFDDRWPELNHIEHWPVIGNTESLLHSCTQYDGVIIAIGNNVIRLEKQTLLTRHHAHFPTLIHPVATVSQYATLGKGSVVMAAAVINPFASLGHACIINTSATVDHDCCLADGVHISPGSHLAGGVNVGESSWVGIGANVKQLITIGHHVVVAAGATVVDNLSDGLVVMGTPAQPRNHKE
ncbi:acetyltransferase [Vibrio sp. 10N.286.49.B3]|uniref:acetyltransferase n=1 Tax=Vibrio sp. 10N.286.49.B3 TaxID=1880855 RepID=UPI000C81E993|nr:acetyltransferase [Vibrio sp. 10N.286.49.B3]PMH45946.1 acetyltransferase [Vibrio sp. 10N.286.49.B3]